MSTTAKPLCEPHEFPLDKFRDAARELRRPFTPAAVKFKVQATWPKDNPTGGLIVCYIDARLVVERLNMIVPDLWFDAYEPTAKGLMWCHLTVDGITRSDVGEGEGKALVSDAFKRAAVKFGVGVSLYATPKLTLNVSDGHLKVRGQGDRAKVEMTPNGETRVRGIYSKWLTERGIQAYGGPLDHGDAEGAAGDTEVTEPPPPRQPSVPEPPKREAIASATQQKYLLDLSDELVLAPGDLADAVCAAMAKPSREFSSMDEAYDWCQRAVAKLPARMVGVVETKLRKMVGQKIDEAVAAS